MNGQPIGELKAQLGKLKEERDELQQDVQEERAVVQTMQQELAKMKHQQQTMGGKLRDKELALQDYNRMIKESEGVLKSLIETSNTFLKTITGESDKLRGSKK